MDSNRKNSNNGPTGGVGGTGNTGDTGTPGITENTDRAGGTGASGLGGEIGKAISSIMDMEEGIDTFAKKVAYAGLYGATGGEGQPGQIEEAIKDGNSLAELTKKFNAQVNGMDDAETILTDFNECQASLDLVLSKTNSVNAYFAFMQGKRLLRLQGLRSQQGASRDWVKWITIKLPNLKKRSREKYMALAAVPGVENHLAYGVERLAEFGVLYSSKSDEDKVVMGADPFNKYLEVWKINMDSSYEECKALIDAGLEVGKLNRMGVEFPLDVMVSFLRVEDPLTGEERRHLKKLYQDDPQGPIELLNRIIGKKLKRKNLIAGTDTPPPPETKAENSDDDSTDSSPDKPLTGPNIDRMVVSLCRSLEPVATQAVKFDGSIDRDALAKLKAYIETLLAMPQQAEDAVV